MENQEHFLTVSEVAERLKVHPDKVRVWIRSGQITAIDVSANPGSRRACYRISEEEFECFKRRREVSPAPIVSRRPKIKKLYTRW